MTISRRLLQAGVAAGVSLAAAVPAVAQGGFGTAPRTVTVPVSAPQVELHGVTVAMGPTYDRVVFTFRGGPPPGVRVRYVNRLTQDGSGAPVTIPGNAFLEIVFSPARAHDQDTGAASCAPTRLSPTLPMLRHVRLVGDFEGQVTEGLGLRARTPFRVLRSVSRRVVIVDVRR